jgi:phage terminase large subunit-like protein
MSQKYDLTAFVLVFMRAARGAVARRDEVKTTRRATSRSSDGVAQLRAVVLPFFWLPADTLTERVKQDRVPYDQWREAGLLRVTEGNVIDYDAILAFITGELTDRFPRLKGAEIGYDPAFATDIATKLGRAGYQPASRCCRTTST